VSASSGFALATARKRVTALRDDHRQRLAVAVLGVVVGLGLGTVSWYGLVLGGAIVALPARSFARGLAAGLGLGVLELLLFAWLLAANGALGPALTTGMVGGLSLGLGLAGPVLGSLIRGVV